MYGTDGANRFNNFALLINHHNSYFFITQIKIGYYRLKLGENRSKAVKCYGN